MNKTLFIINGNAITVCPNVMWKKVGYLLLIIFPCLCFTFFAAFDLLEIKPVIIILVTILISVLPFFYIGSRRVILDGNTQTVYYKSLFGTGKSFSFHEIENVALVNQLSYGAITGGYYRLTLKKNPYGKGIQLSMGHQKTAKPFIDFEQKAVPFIQKLLVAHQPDTETDNRRNAIETAAAGFIMFRQKDGMFVSKPIKTINLVLAIALFGFGCYIMIGMVNTNQFKKEYYGLFAFIAGIANLGIWGERVLLNPFQHTIGKSYLGLFRKTFMYKRIIGFNTLRRVNGLDNPTDIRIEIDNGTSIQQVTLFSKIGKAKKVQVLMDELKRILTA